MNPAARPTAARTTGRWSSLRVFLVAFAVFAGLGAAWAMTSAPMSVPDEQAHTLHAAAVVRGQLVGESSTTVPGWKDVRVPRYVAEIPQQLCSAYYSDHAQSCAPAITDSTTPTTAVTSAGTYDPLTYFWSGLPSLFLDGAPGIYGMRLASMLLSAAMLAGAAAALTRLPARTFSLTALGVAVTPMVLFLTAGVNPQGTEIAAGVMTLAWAAVLARSATRGQVQGVEVLWTVLPAIVLANTRSVAMVWLLAYVVATFAHRSVLPVLLRSRVFWIGAAAVLVGVVAAVVWTLAANSLAVTADGGSVGTSFPRAFVSMLLSTFEWTGSYVGLIGWLDTPLPATTVTVWGAFLLVPVVAALVFGRGRTRWTVIVLTVALVLLPPLIQGQAAHDYGFIWQGRYNLALVCALVVAAGIALDDVWPRAAAVRGVPVLLGFVVVAMVLMQVHSFVWMAKRYTVGLDTAWTAMVRSPAWQPPGTWEVWTVLLTASAVAGAALLLGVVRTGRTADAADDATGTAAVTTAGGTPHATTAPDRTGAATTTTTPDATTPETQAVEER